jgi:dolichol-phosphate mannosyltransferase
MPGANREPAARATSRLSAQARLGRTYHLKVCPGAWPHKRHGTNLSRALLGKFLVVGGTGVVVNSAALYAFYQLLRLPLIAASALAVALAIGNNFVLNDRWTFAEHHRSAWFLRFVRFSLASVGGLTLASLTLWLLVTYLGVQYVIANLVGISLGTASNLTVSMMWTWARSSE